MPTERSYNSGLALLKLIAAFGIVGCHLNMRPTTPMGEILLHFTDTNVALFGILSGYFLTSSLERAQGAWSFICKKAKRLLPVYVIWSLFYLLIKFGFDCATTGHLTESFKSPMRWFYIIFWGDAAAHLWYVISLFYVSVVLCLLRRWLRWLWLVLAVGAFIWVMKGWGGFYSWYPGRLLACVLVGVGVWRLRSMLDRLPLGAYLIFLLAGLGVHMLLSWRAPVVIYDTLVSVPIVVIVARCSWNMPSSLAWLAQCSFGVYLVHVVFAFAVGSMARTRFAEPYGVGPVIGVWVGVIVLSVSTTCILRRISAIRKFCE